MQVVEEIFGKCGEIQTLRMSKKDSTKLKGKQENESEDGPDEQVEVEGVPLGCS